MTLAHVAADAPTQRIERCRACLGDADATPLQLQSHGPTHRHCAECTRARCDHPIDYHETNGYGTTFCDRCGVVLERDTIPDLETTS